VTDAAWSPAEATSFLIERELFGMRFELGRIKALLSELGDPHKALNVVHVVGTNGKTSVTTFATSLLANLGHKAGGYISPHLTGFHERVLLPDGLRLRTATPEEFAGAVQRVAAAARVVEEAMPDGEVVTQFELVTAAALLLLRDFGVSHAAIEAGLGGRWDATNVFESPKVVVLSSIGLDHVKWLGADELSILKEKLAVLGSGDSLVAPRGLPVALSEAAEVIAADAGATVLWNDPPEVGWPLSARGGFQQGNFALAVAAVTQLVGEVDEGAIEASCGCLIAGRLQQVDTSPATYVDSAHNPQGAAALAAAVALIADGSGATFVVGLLEDKDAAAFVAAILPQVNNLVVTQPLNPRALDAERLAEVAVAAGLSPQQITVVPVPTEALNRGRTLAGPSGLVVAAGSVHLAGDLLSAPGERVVTSL